ncbi:MAG: Tex-like N-terminal domain-containing protein, partial [Planctomycetia bacterium]
MDEVNPMDLGRLAQDLQLKRRQVESVVRLLAEGHPVSFIVHYRKEEIGALQEDQVRRIRARVEDYHVFDEKRRTIVKSLESQGFLSDELKQALDEADSLHRLDDLYLPFRPRLPGPGDKPRAQGLEPLADAVWTADPSVLALDEMLIGVVDVEKDLSTVDEVRGGLVTLLAEKLSELPDVRAEVRRALWFGDIVTSKSTTWTILPEAEKTNEFRNFFDHREPVAKISPARVLLVNRGERQGMLTVQLETDFDRAEANCRDMVPLDGHPHGSLIASAWPEAMRMVFRALDREIRGDLTEAAERHAADTFARNLRTILLQRGVEPGPILAIDPGFRTGCIFTVLDPSGKVLEHGIVYPHSKRKKKKKKKKKPAPPMVGAEPSYASAVAEGDAPSPAPLEDSPAETSSVPSVTSDAPAVGDAESAPAPVE